MNHRSASDCANAREQLSARFDGERRGAASLEEHLAGCAECGAHERSLAALARAFAELREPAPVTDLWAGIERRARPRATPLYLRAAAALVGFALLGGALLLIERERAAPSERHLLESLAHDASEPDALFAGLPEYRLLRALPAREGTR